MKQDRVTLKNFFQTGAKPTALNFSDFIDSFYSKLDDGITTDASNSNITFSKGLTFLNGLTIGNSTLETPGSIRWNGTTFQFRDGIGWKNIDAFGNNLEGISSDANKNTTLSNGLTIGNSTLETPGTIRWNGTTFQFRDGTGWKDILSGTGSQWTTVGTDINLATGKAAIGLPTSTSPTYKFEVELANMAAGTNDNAVKLGSLAIYKNSTTFSSTDPPMLIITDYAYVSHMEANSDPLHNYGLRLVSTGDTALNCKTGRKIDFQEGGATKATIVGGVLCIGDPLPQPPGTVNNEKVLLAVNGQAAKLTEGGFVTLGSDERLKTNIRPFNDGLAKLKKLNPVNYEYNGKAGIAQGKEHTGLIAQDVLKVFPYMVGSFHSKMNEDDEKETELLSLDTNPLIYVMVNAIKEIDDRLSKLEKPNSGKIK